MEISQDAGKDTEEDGKKSYDAWSESRDHEDFNNDEPQPE